MREGAQPWSWGGITDSVPTDGQLRRARMDSWNVIEEAPHKTWVSVEMRFITLEFVPGYTKPVLMGPGEVLPSREALLRMRAAARSLGFRSLRQAIERGCLPDVLSEAIEGEEAPCPACEPEPNR